MHDKNIFWTFISVIVASILFSYTARADDFSDPIVNGKDEFAWHCASCHGEDAKGTGKLAKILVKPPVDLTQITERNGGTFPHDRVFKIIAGTEAVPGHSTFQMPKYWERFRHYEGRRGYDTAEKRIHTITLYLESLQGK